MTTNDPRVNPDTSPIFSNNHSDPYARRSVSSIFTVLVMIVVIAFVFGFFMSWRQVNEESGGGTSAGEQMLADVKGGLEKIGNSALNIKNVEYLNNQNLEGNSSDAVYLSNVETAAGIETVRSVPKSTFNGKILDFEGNVAGDITAIKYDDGDSQHFVFSLKQALTPADKPRTYKIPVDDVKVVGEEDAFFIQLNEMQTRALAEQLYEEAPKN